MEKGAPLTAVTYTRKSHIKIAVLSVLVFIVLFAIYRGFTLPTEIRGVYSRINTGEEGLILQSEVMTIAPSPSLSPIPKQLIAGSTKNRIRPGENNVQVDEPKLQSTSQWRVYGGVSVNNDGMTHRQHKERNNLFSYPSNNKKIQNVVNRLESRAINCSHTPLEYQRSLSKKLEIFMKALANYSSFHAQNRGKSSSMKLTWVCSTSFCGGLADRLRGITYSFLLAMISQRIFLVDWSERMIKYNNYLEPNIIDWRLTPKEKQTVFKILVDAKKDSNRKTPNCLTLLAGAGTSASMPDPKYRKMLQIFVGDNPFLAMRTNLLPSGLLYGRVPKTVDWIQTGLTSLGLDKLNKFEFDQLMGVVFRYLFKFSNDIVKEMAAARLALGLIEDITYVGIHVRTGFLGSKTEENSHYKLSRDPEQWKSAFQCALSVFDGDKVPIFLATDSNMVKNMALWQYSTRVRSLNNSVIHVSHLKAEKDAEVCKEGMKSAWVELVLLAEAHTVVMGESGYSFLAQSLCLMPQSRVLSGNTCRSKQLLE